MSDESLQPARSRFTREQMLDAIREVLSDTPTTSTEVYERSGRRPSYTTIARVFGSWNNAVTEAGLHPTSPSSHRKTQFTRGDPSLFVNAVMECMIDLDTVPTHKMFEAWRRGRSPSASWLRAYSGITFMEARRRAIIELGEDNSDEHH